MHVPGAKVPLAQPDPTIVDCGHETIPLMYRKPFTSPSMADALTCETSLNSQLTYWRI